MIINEQYRARLRAAVGVLDTAVVSEVSMVPAERRQRILEHIRANRSAKIRELATILGVSEATVRRDLTELASEGLIRRSYGGAVLPSSTSFEWLHSEKRLICQEEKRRIGTKAASMVADGETLILDSGSTTLEIARQLTKRKGVTIITNDLYIASTISYDPTTTLIVTGGFRREGFNVLVGPIAEELLRRVKVDRTFLAADAVDLVHGVMNATFAEVPIKQLIIQAAKEVVLVADHTKFGKVALAKVCSLTEVHHVITDTGVAGPVLEELGRLGIPVSLA